MKRILIVLIAFVLSSEVAAHPFKAIGGFVAKSFNGGVVAKEAVVAKEVVGIGQPEAGLAIGSTRVGIEKKKEMARSEPIPTIPSQ